MSGSLRRRGSRPSFPPEACRSRLRAAIIESSVPCGAPRPVLGGRPTVGRMPLEHVIGVRIPASQPDFARLRRASSGQASLRTRSLSRRSSRMIRRAKADSQFLQRRTGSPSAETAYVTRDLRTYRLNRSNSPTAQDMRCAGACAGSGSASSTWSAARPSRQGTTSASRAMSRTGSNGTTQDPPVRRWRIGHGPLLCRWNSRTNRRRCGSRGI